MCNYPLYLYAIHGHCNVKLFFSFNILFYLTVVLLECAQQLIKKSTSFGLMSDLQKLNARFSSRAHWWWCIWKILAYTCIWDALQMSISLRSAQHPLSSHLILCHCCPCLSLDSFCKRQKSCWSYRPEGKVKNWLASAYCMHAASECTLWKMINGSHACGLKVHAGFVHMIRLRLWI